MIRSLVGEVKDFVPGRINPCTLFLKALCYKVSRPLLPLTMSHAGAACRRSCTHALSRRRPFSNRCFSSVLACLVSTPGRTSLEPLSLLLVLGVDLDRGYSF